MAVAGAVSLPTYRAQVAKGFIFSTVGTNLRSQTSESLSLSSARKLFDTLAYKGQESFIDTPVSLGNYRTFRVKQNNFRGEFIKPQLEQRVNHFEFSKHNQNKEKIILYLHGGSFFSGNPSTHRIIPINILRNLYINVFSCDYSKVPENPFPTALNNVSDAYNYLTQVKNYSPENIVVVGDSSGGNLAISLSLKLQNEKRPQPAAIVALTPWLDLSLSGMSHKANIGVDPLFGGSLPLLSHVASKYSNDVNNPLVSPIFADTTQLKNLPPTLIISADDDVFYSDSSVFVNNATNAGNSEISHVHFPNTFHSWMLFNTPETFLAAQQMSSFIFDRLKLRTSLIH